jgi:phosphomannomutase
MNNVYIFDVDGTLTPSRKPMTREFLKFFDTWSKENTFYLVSGSDLEKMSEQVPPHILERAAGLFCCGGNDYYKDGKQVYYNEFIPPKELIQFLEETLLNSQYETRAGNHIEDRGSMLNFSVVGRDCSDEQREDYFQYDLQSKEREIISGLINEDWVDIEAVIGGQISIDIAPRGNDKSQVLKHIMKEQPNKKYFFVGDRTMEGGNDYPLANLMNNTDDCYSFQAGEPSDEFGFTETFKILKYEIHEGYPDFEKSPHLKETETYTTSIDGIMILKGLMGDDKVFDENLEMTDYGKKRFSELSDKYQYKNQKKNYKLFKK